MLQPRQRSRKGQLLEQDQQLRDAVYDSEITQVKKLLRKKANPMSKNLQGMNALHIAAQKGNLLVFNLLLKVEGADVSVISDDGKEISDAYPIHYAAYYGHADVLKRIIEFDRGASLNKLDGCGMSALHEAIATSSYLCVDVLLGNRDTDINIEKVDGDGDTIPNGSTPLFQAILGDHLYVVDKLLKLKRYLDFSLPTDFANDYRYVEYDGHIFPDDGNVLNVAARLAKVDFVKLLLLRMSAKLINEMDSVTEVQGEAYGGRSAFEYAIESDVEDCVLAFLDSKEISNVNPVVDYKKTTLLQKAVCQGWTRVIDALAKINPNFFKQKTSLGVTLVQLAVKYNYESLKKLTQLQNAKIIEIDANDFNPNFTAQEALQRDANKIRKAIYQIDWSQLKFYKKLRDEEVIKIGEKDFGLNVDDLSSAESDESCFESDEEAEGNLYFVYRGLDQEESEGEDEDVDDEEEEASETHSGDDLSSAESDEAQLIEPQDVAMSDKRTIPIDDLPPLPATYKSGNLKAAKLLHKFSGIDPRRPLPGMIDPGSYIDEDNIELKRLRDQELARPFTETTTAGSSSYPSISGGRALQAAALIPGTSEQKITPDIQKLLDELNKKIQNKESINYDEYPFVVAHFRGINFNQKYFPKVHGKESFVKNAKDVGIHSAMSYAISGIKLGEGLTQDEDAKLREIDSNIVKFWQKLGKRKNVNCYWDKRDKTKLIFDKLSYLMQERYTNLANKTYEKNVYVDIWEEIWINFKEDRELLKELRAATNNNGAQLKGNPIISFGKTPGHAIRYAVGRSLSGQHRETRADTRLRNTGKSKHRLIGAVYIVLHTLEDYFEAKPSDTTKLHRKEKISVNPNYIHETEVAFPGGVAKENIATIFPVYFPTFELAWNELDNETRQHYLKFYGFNQDKYMLFYKRSHAGKRPEKIDHTIFDNPWQKDYLQIHGIGQAMFGQFKQLLDSQPTKLDAIEEYKSLARVLGKKIQTITHNSENPLLSKNVFKNAVKIDHDEMRNVIDKILRDINPYRVLKNELRDHFAGYTDNQKRRFVGGHVSKLVLEEAFKHANQRRQFLVYRNADGLFNFYDKDPDLVRKKIVACAQTHPDSVKRKGAKQLIPAAVGSVKKHVNSSATSMEKKDSTPAMTSTVMSLSRK